MFVCTKLDGDAVASAAAEADDMARVDVVVHGCLHATDVVTRPERASRRRAKVPTRDADDDDAMMVGNGACDQFCGLQVRTF